MRMRYRDGTEDDDELFDLLLECQRSYVARCIQLGPNWIKACLSGCHTQTLRPTRYRRQQ